MNSTFHDGKEEGALRTIGEVAEALGIKPHVLRYWEQQFPMLSPLKRSGGRRYYRSGDIDLVKTIDRLVNVEGYTLKGAKSAIREGKANTTSGTNRSAFFEQDNERDDTMLEQLKLIRTRLADAIKA